MPCFRDLSSDRFGPIQPSERAFIQALVSLAPDVLAPVLTQLDDAGTCDDGTGWLVVREARGEPVSWPEGYPFDVVPAAGVGPQGCYCVMLWFYNDGQLQAIEILMLEDASLQLNALTTWLSGAAAFKTSSSP